jgi:GR25 family glycosyltransferase involved in LPS biosynthesis
VGLGRASRSQLRYRDLREIRGDLDAVRNAVVACLVRSAPRRSHIPLRVLDFGVARRLGCVPMETQAAIAGIPVYVISLKDSETRRRNMTERLAALGIPFQFVDAVDGRFRRLPDRIDGARVIRERFNSEAGLACAASHRLVHRMIAEGDSDVALILEDDAKLASDFPQVLASAARINFDVFKLEGRPYYRYHTTVDRIGRRSVVVGTVTSLGAAYYLISKDVARRFCGLTVLDRACDVAFADPRLWLRILEVKPFVAIQDGAAPDLRSNPQEPNTGSVRNDGNSDSRRTSPFGAFAGSTKAAALLARCFISQRDRATRVTRTAVAWPRVGATPQWWRSGM